MEGPAAQPAPAPVTEPMHHAPIQTPHKVQAKQVERPLGQAAPAAMTEATRYSSMMRRMTHGDLVVGSMSVLVLTACHALARAPV